MFRAGCHTNGQCCSSSSTEPTACNLQSKRLYSKELDRYVRVKVATSTLRTIRKLGLDETAKKYNVDLSKF